MRSCMCRLRRRRFGTGLEVHSIYYYFSFGYLVLPQSTFPRPTTPTQGFREHEECNSYPLNRFPCLATPPEFGKRRRDHDALHDTRATSPRLPSAPCWQPLARPVNVATGQAAVTVISRNERSATRRCAKDAAVETDVLDARFRISGCGPAIVHEFTLARSKANSTRSARNRANGSMS